MPYITAFDIADEITIECWFMILSNKNCVATMVGKAASGADYTYQLKFSGNSSGDNYVQAEFKNQLGVNKTLDTGGVFFETLKWHHACFTFDGQDAKMFLNGVKVNETNSFAGMTILNRKDNDTLSIGAPNDGGWALGNNAGGYISEAAVYARAISEAEAIGRYEQGKNVN